MLLGLPGGAGGLEIGLLSRQSTRQRRALGEKVAVR